MNQNQMQSKPTDAEQPADKGLDETPCSAVLWVHTHFETGVPIQIDPVEWYGRVDLLDYVTDEKNFGDIKIEVPTESWINARIEYDIDDWHYCSVKILPNETSPSVGATE